MRPIWLIAATLAITLCPASAERPPSTPVDPVVPKGFDWTTLVTSGPINKILESFGINATEHIEQATRRALETPWDDRIQLITDKNFHDEIVYEEMTEEDEEKRLWFLIITMGMAKDPISNFVDQQFDLAYNISLEANDIPHVRWGRIDYMNVTAITTRWFVWKAPVLVVAHDRGRTLRFYRLGQIRLDPDVLHQFLKKDGWKETDPWSSSFAPGGRYEPWIFQCGEIAAKYYNIVASVPKWLVLVISGILGSFLVSFLHGGGKKPSTTRRKVVRHPVGRPAEAIASSVTTQGALKKRSAVAPT